MDDFVGMRVGFGLMVLRQIGLLVNAPVLVFASAWWWVIGKVIFVRQLVQGVVYSRKGLESAECWSTCPKEEVICDANFVRA